MRDKEVIEAANEAGIAMVFTGERLERFRSRGTSMPKDDYSSFQEGAGRFEAAMEGVRAFRLLMQEYPAIPTMKRLLALRLDDPTWATVRPPFLPADEAAGIRLEERLAAL